MADAAAVRTRPAFRAVAAQPWTVTAGEFLAVLALSVSLSGLIRGGGWWIAVVLTGALVLLCGAAARILGVLPSLVAPAQAAVALVVITAVFAPSAAFLGFVPTAGSFAALVSLGSRSLTEINRDSVPAPASEALLLAVVVGTAAMTILIDALAATLRRPVLAGLVVAAMLVLPSIALGPNPWSIAVCAFSFFYLIRCGERAFRAEPARPGAAFLVSVGAVLAAVLATALVPGASSLRSANGIGPDETGVGVPGSTTVSPLVALGADLRQPKAVTVFDYTTTSAEPPYLKLMALNEFSGTTWTRSVPQQQRLRTGAALPPEPGLSGAVAAGRVVTRIRISGLISRFLPAPSIVTSVRGLSGDWSLSPADLTIAAGRSTGAEASTHRGQTYTVDSAVIDPTVAQLDEAGRTIPRAVRADLALPSAVPAVITRTARAATAGAATPYQEALDLQDYFRDSGFVYSTSTPLKEGYDGSGLAVIAKFLSVKSGYCIHFASAMAVMARVLGIPAVIDVGYVPGQLVRELPDGRAEYAVSSNDLHAWPVLYLSGLGWVAFEPTVGTATIPSYSAPSATGLVQGSGALAGARSTRAAQQRRLLVQSGSGKKTLAHPAAQTRALSAAGRVLAWLALAALAGVLAIGAVSSIARQRRRRRRLGYRDRRRSAVASDAWDEIRESAIDLGLPVPRNATPRALSRALRECLRNAPGVAGSPPAAVDEAIERLRAATEWERFGPEPIPAARIAGPGGGSWHRARLGDWPIGVMEDIPDIPAVPVVDDARTVLRAMRRRAGAGRRLAARVVPRAQWARTFARARRRTIDPRDKSQERSVQRRSP